MTDKPRQTPDRDAAERSVSSPFDRATERIPTTDEDLGLLPTEQIPTYRGASLPPIGAVEPVVEQMRFDDHGVDDGRADNDTEVMRRDNVTEELRTADSYDRELAATFAAAQAVPEVVAPAPVAATPRGTLDLGLLVLRVALGAVAVAHGLQKLFGVWGGPGMDGFETYLLDAGFQQARLLAVVGAVGEVAAGICLVVGLLTPLAAAGLLALMINAWCVRQAAEPGFQFFAPGGVELETVLGAALVALILTGPGRISVDGRRRWATRPHVGSSLALILGVAGGVCLWVFLNGSNPLT
ncbi:DoxX family protein [Rhodococcus sp. NPDC127528]|uniref:DoxX family protein n=1 Tax=unclassified Rhodococcus (in: high G+C Gram-positive bacteria) TaxID=192944 RepID=UPI003626AEDB